MDAVRSDGTEFPVSVWMKGVKTEDEPRVIVVVEPVARANAHFTLNPPTKEILTCDENFATLFGYLEPHEVVGKRITNFVPSVVIPEVIGNEEETLQQLTGRSKANTVFPLTVTFTAKEYPQANAEDDDRVQGMHVHMYIFTCNSCILPWCATAAVAHQGRIQLLCVMVKQNTAKCDN